MRTEVKTHREIETTFMEGVKRRVCRELNLSSDAYDMMHFDLAYEWFSCHDFLEYTARVFLVSNQYHRWWAVQVVQIESLLLKKWGNQGFSPAKLRSALEAAVLNFSYIPAAGLRREMHNEGIEVLRRSPELKNLKIYHHE